MHKLKHQFPRLEQWRQRRKAKNIAVCFYGRLSTRTIRDERPIEKQVESRVETIHPEISYRTFNQHIAQRWQPDIFIHSWETGYKDELIRFYHPISEKIEHQIQFYPPPGGFSNMMSCWYSMKESVKLMEEYEKVMGITYDRVMLTRLDLLYFSDFDFASYTPGKIQIPRHPANNFPAWMLDWYYISTPSKIKKLSRLYDHINDYFPVSHTTIGSYIVDYVAQQISDTDKCIGRDVMIPRYMNMILEGKNHPNRHRISREIRTLVDNTGLTRRGLTERYGIPEAEWDTFGYDVEL